MKIWFSTHKPSRGIHSSYQKYFSVDLNFVHKRLAKYSLVAIYVVLSKAKKGRSGRELSGQVQKRHR